MFPLQFLSLEGYQDHLNTKQTENTTQTNKGKRCDPQRTTKHEEIRTKGSKLPRFSPPSVKEVCAVNDPRDNYLKDIPSSTWQNLFFVTYQKAAPGYPSWKD